MRSSATAARAAVIVLFCCPVLKAQGPVPRIEIGAVLSSTSQSYIGNYFHTGGGGRVAFNITRYLAGEVEATRQPTGNPSTTPENHTFIAAKGTYRAEQRRWLGFAGLNFFGVIGPAFVNRSVLLCIGACGYLLQRQTASMLEYGGGVELVPARRVAVRFDVSHANLSEPDFGSSLGSSQRTYFKAAVMLRVR